MTLRRGVVARHVCALFHVTALCVSCLSFGAVVIDAILGPIGTDSVRLFVEHAYNAFCKKTFTLKSL